jgi:two-component system phosphate regulon sensor histidine kinase PhoR
VRLKPLLIASVAVAGLTGPAVAALLLWAGWSVLAAELAGTACALALGGGLALALARRHGQRVADLAAAVQRYASGDLGGRLGHLGQDELTALARGIDAAFREVDARATALVRDRERSDAILAGMGEGVLVVDEVGRLRLANDAARAMLRLDDGAVGRRYLEVLRHPNLVAQIGRTLHGERPEGAELSIAQPQPQTIVSRAAPVTADGRGGAVVVLHDNTDLRRAARVRRDFVANVSHELRTPLTAIRGYVEALLEGPASPEQGQRFLGIIGRHSARMESLVRELLRLARLDAGQETIDRATCQVESIWSGVLAELAPAIEARRQSVGVDVAPDARAVVADPAKLHDVFRNLVENASNYAPEGSRITLEASADTSWVYLRVLDEGPGIPAEDLTRVFERFYRVDRARSRDTGGTGLGLSIVKHLVELHGGRVTAANRPEGGAVFTVALRREGAPGAGAGGPRRPTAG